jgi:hypothetical protein
MKTRKTTTASKRERIATIIQALLSKTTENGATEAEAMAAAEKARELMDKHQLDLGTIGIEREGAHRVTIKRGHYKTLAVKDRLASAVATFCDTRAWLTKHSDELHFFGLRSDAGFASWLIVSLESFVSAGALNFIASQPRMEARPRWEAEKAFVLGAIDRINVRLVQLAAERTKAMKGDGKGLVVHKTAMVATAFDALSFQLCKGGKFGAEAKDGGSYAAGRAAGDRASFGKPVNGGGKIEQIAAKS